MSLCRVRPPQSRKRITDISFAFYRELGLLRAALGGSDQETVVDSDPPSDPEKDWVRGLAQRATDPEFKEHKKKGPFVVSQA